MLAAGLAWLIPAHWRSIHPAVLAAAGDGTDSLAQAAQNALARNLVGPALQLSEAGGLTNLQSEARQRATVQGLQWLGGADPAVLEVFGPASRRATTSSAIFPIFDVLIIETNRLQVRRHLAESRSPGVQTILGTREMSVRRFVPAGQPGGQPLESIIYLTALLYEREQLAPALGSEIRALAEKAPIEELQAQALEDVYLHLLVLARRLDWTSLGELLKIMPSAQSLRRFAEATKVDSDDLATLYAAAIWSANPDGISTIATLGPQGRSTLRQSVASGAGAIRWLARHPRVANRGGPFLPGTAQLMVHSPMWLLAARWVLFGMAGCLLSLAIGSFSASTEPPSIPAQPGKKSRPTPALPLGFVAIVTALTLFLLSEPGLTRPAKPPGFEVRLNTPLLTPTTALKQTQANRKVVMEWSTIASIAFFAALQITVYITCLRKIREIENLLEEPLLKLRLLENEENLFDAGLYVGIGGTATALVLQVLGLIEANLLAAYSSNLMGIIGVALVKIRHVRPYKRTLIIEGSNALQPG